MVGHEPFSGALIAYFCSGDTACQKALWGQVQRLTREQLADGFIALLLQLQKEVWCCDILLFCHAASKRGTQAGRH